MEERRRTQRRRKDRDSIVGGPRIIASDHPAVNGLSDTHEGRGHACKGIRMQGRVSPCTRTNAWVNGWPWVGESLRRGQKRRERNPFWRLPLTTLSLSLSVSQCAELCNSLSVSLSLVFFGSSSLLRTDSGWSFIRLPIQGGRVHYCGWNITGGMRRNLVCFFFFFFIRAWTSFFLFFPFLSSKFVWIENSSSLVSTLFPSLEKFFLFFFCSLQLLEQPFGFRFFFLTEKWVVRKRVVQRTRVEQYFLSVLIRWVII